MDHRQAIEAIAGALRDAPDIRALFLSGSHATGLADAYSDIDFVLVTPSGATDATAALWREAVARTGEIVLWWDRTVRPALINAVTAEWLRVDVVILKPDQMSAQRQDGLLPVFDHDGLYSSLAATTAPRSPDPRRVRYMIEEFIRILGLLHLAAGREEYINGVLGVFHLRNLLVDLIIEETAAPNRGGALHLNRLLTEGQKAELIGLPAAVPAREAMISAHLAYAVAFLPRARRLADRWGVDWPERFEEVTWEKLRSALGVERPYNPNDRA